MNTYLDCGKVIVLLLDRPYSYHNQLEGGKPSCRDSYLAIVGGITWLIFPLLQLQTDQVSKLTNYENAILVSINLDTYKTSIMDRMAKRALELSSDITSKRPLIDWSE